MGLIASIIAVILAFVAGVKVGFHFFKKLTAGLIIDMIKDGDILYKYEDGTWIGSKELADRYPKKLKDHLEKK
jgi:hypothetical protein